MASHSGSKHPDLRIVPLPNVICGTYADVRIACFEDRYLKENHPIGYLQENLIYQAFLVSTFLSFLLTVLIWFKFSSVWYNTGERALTLQHVKPKSDI